jgi:hypothetical protein
LPAQFLPTSIFVLSVFFFALEGLSVSSLGLATLLQPACDSAEIAAIGVPSEAAATHMKGQVAKTACDKNEEHDETSFVEKHRKPCYLRNA